MHVSYNIMLIDHEYEFKYYKFKIIIIFITFKYIYIFSYISKASVYEILKSKNLHILIFGMILLSFYQNFSVRNNKNKN